MKGLLPYSITSLRNYLKGILLSFYTDNEITRGVEFRDHIRKLFVIYIRVAKSHDFQEQSIGHPMKQNIFLATHHILASLLHVSGRQNRANELLYRAHISLVMK